MRGLLLATFDDDEASRGIISDWAMASQNAEDSYHVAACAKGPNSSILSGLGGLVDRILTRQNAYGDNPSHILRRFENSYTRGMSPTRLMQ
jgi:hypothetical protein